MRALARGKAVAVAALLLRRGGGGWWGVGVVASWWRLLLLWRVGFVAALSLLLCGWLHLLRGRIRVSVVYWTLVPACAQLLRVAGVQGVDAVWSDLALKCWWWLLLVAID